MKLHVLAAATVAALGSSACSTMNEPVYGPHAGMNAGQQCATYRASMEGASPQEQRAAAAAHITTMHGSADEAHIDRHLRMMETTCGAKPAAGVYGR